MIARRRPRINGDRLLRRIDLLAGVGADAQGSLTRVAWSLPDREAVALVGSWAAEAGAKVRTDPVGSLIAEFAGHAAGLLPLAMGSHLDTVVGAGRLDGAFGVVAGVEILDALSASGLTLRHPLRLAAFVNEEGVVASPFTGSRAAAGHDLSGELDVIGGDGVSLRQRMSNAGSHPDRAGDAAWGAVAGYLEIHIEQGPVLHANNCPVAVVTAVTGQIRLQVDWQGRANHAGTTPMDMRRDALVAASKGVIAVAQLAAGGTVTVATVGRLDVEPNVSNVIPGSVRFSVDLRSVDDAEAAEAVSVLRRTFDDIARTTTTTVAVSVTSSSSAVPTDIRWRRILHESCRRAGTVALDLASGAGHDAQHIAELGPIGMLFVPSIDGVSHHPGENTAGPDLVRGVEIALDALLAADEDFDG